MKEASPADTPVIRIATLSDVAAIFDLIRENPEELITRSFNDLVQNIDRFFVAEVGDRIVGCASWGILPEIGDISHTSVEIKSVAVQSNWRGRDIGSRLVKAVIDRVLPLRVAQLLVLTFSPAFFAKLGFAEIPKTQIMHKIYMGCINCTKHADPFTCPEVAMTLVPERPRT